MAASRRGLAVTAMLLFLLLSPAIPTARAAPSVVANIPSAAFPFGLAYDSGKGEIYVLNSHYPYNAKTDYVSVVSQATDAVVANVSVPFSEGSGIVYDAGRNELFVPWGPIPAGTPNAGADGVYVISDSTNQVVANFTPKDPLFYPGPVAYDGARGEIYMTGQDAFTVISDLSNTEVTSVSDSAGPGPLAYDGEKSEVFVGDQFTDSLGVYSDTSNARVANVSLGETTFCQCIESLVYYSEKGEVFASVSTRSQSQPNAVYAISDSTNSIVSTFPFGAAPTANFGAMAIDDTDGELFVANGSAVDVVPLSSAKATETIPLQLGDIQSMAYDSATGQLFVGGTSSNVGSVEVISLAGTSAGSVSTTPEFQSNLVGATFLVALVVVSLILRARPSSRFLQT